MKDKKKIRLGIIGKNFGYNVIYKSFLKNKNCKVLGFSFKSNKRKNKINIPGNIKLYPNWKKLILDKNINAVAIASPPGTHKNIIKFALKNNKHIFCEKPLTCSFNEANYISKLINKRKISHLVNYEFAEIDAFKVFKRKVLNKKINIKKIDVNWFLNIKRKNKSWKDHHIKGGGMMFNYVCHTIYYLEFLFGKIYSIKVSNFNKINKNFSFIDCAFFFKSGLFARIKVTTDAKPNIKPIHKIKIETDKNIYFLKSNINNLYDQFTIAKLSKNKQNKSKFIFKNKKSRFDFRIKPTYKNSLKFSSSILKKKECKPNFYTARRIHLIIDKMIFSALEKKEMYIN